MTRIYYICPDHISEVDLQKSKEEEYEKLVNENKAVVYHSFINFINAFNDGFISDLGMLKCFVINAHE